MSKRKLSLQQRRRIAEQRAKRKAERAQKALVQEDENGEQNLTELEPGLVIAHFGHDILVEGENGRQKCHMRANLELCTGDKVMWRSGHDFGVVESRDTRVSEIQRPDIYGKLRTIAANVTQLVITIAPEPEAHTNLIDRYIVAAHIHDLQPLILVNKADLRQSEHLDQIAKDYRALGYQLIRVSAKHNKGLEELQACLNNHASIFVGQSGVGKSSLVQSLLPSENIRIGELSSAELKGRHTTTNSQLYHFPSGGSCIDSPGIREFGLWHAGPDDVLASFPEIAVNAQNCRFRDCKHQSEPGCAIKEALATGDVSATRYASYQTILNQLDDVTIKTQIGIKNR